MEFGLRYTKEEQERLKSLSFDKILTAMAEDVRKQFWRTRPADFGAKGYWYAYSIALTNIAQVLGYKPTDLGLQEIEEGTYHKYGVV